MTRSIRRQLSAHALAIGAVAATVLPSLASAGTPGYMACVVNRTGNKARFFYTQVFPRDLEDRKSSAQAMEKLVDRWSDGRYRLEANCIWHELKAPVQNKLADIVEDVEKADVDTFEVTTFKGAE